MKKLRGAQGLAPIQNIAEHPVILTSMAGVNVTVIPGALQEQPFYKIWCDGTFGTYLWETLLAIAIELGGGAIANETFIKEENS